MFNYGQQETVNLFICFDPFTSFIEIEIDYINIERHIELYFLPHHFVSCLIIFLEQENIVSVVPTTCYYTFSIINLATLIYSFDY